MLPSVDEDEPAKPAPQDDQDVDVEHGAQTQVLDEKDVGQIVTCLTEVCRVFVHAEQLIVSTGVSVFKTT